MLEWGHSVPSSIGVQEGPDRVAVVPVRCRAGGAVCVQKDVLPGIRVAQRENRRGHGASALEMDAQPDGAGAGRMGAQRALEGSNHVLDGPRRRFCEETLDQLNFRIRRDVAPFVGEDVQPFVATARRELPILAEEPKVVPRNREEIPEVVFVLADRPLEEYVDAWDARLSQRLEDELTAGARGRRSPAAAVRQGHDEPRPARAEPCPARLP